MNKLTNQSTELLRVVEVVPPVQLKMLSYMNAQYSDLGDLESININPNRRDGYYLGVAKYKRGNTILLFMNADTGLIDARFVSAQWHSIEERDRHIVALLGFGYTQVQTAIIVGVSQATVSGVSRKFSSK